MVEIGLETACKRFTFYEIQWKKKKKNAHNKNKIEKEKMYH